MLDSIEITVYAGRGGKGSVAFRREKFVPLGGPSGGDGGRGGDVLVVGDADMNTLDPYRYKRTHKAEPGGDGGGSKKHGHDGSTLALPVPVGTEVWLKGWERGGDGQRKLLGDLAQDAKGIIVGKGGRGGRGNAKFVTPQLREPVLAEDGEAGQARLLGLELKLLADVGIVGLPNAGKSTLLSAISNARPKVADYPFTTLEPVLGVVGNNMRTLVAVDIPGLIKGAHTGAGLGHEFLKHVERTRILVHIIDGSEPGAAAKWHTVTTELREFDERLGAMQQIVAVNKTDIPEVEERRIQIERELRDALPERTRICFISAAGRTDLTVLVEAMFKLLKVSRQKSEVTQSAPNGKETVPVLRPLARTVEKELAVRDGDGFRVTHERALRLARGSDLSGWKARLQMRAQLKRMGVTRYLEQLGVANGDNVAVGDWRFVWE